jgi:hypothetical protein
MIALAILMLKFLVMAAVPTAVLFTLLWAAQRKPEPDWKAIAGRMHSILADPEEDSAIYCCKRAIRVYEEAAK